MSGDTAALSRGFAAPPAAACHLSVVIPSRNEAENIGPLLLALDAALSSVDREYILVDDSDDGTPERAQATQLAAPLRVIHRLPGERTGGLGGAVREGMLTARGRWACVMDADLQHPPETVASLLAAAESAAADLVVGSRYTGGGSAAGLDGAMRRAVSRAASALPRVVLYPAIGSLADVASGFFLVRHDAVDWASLQPKGFKVLLEILVRTPRLRTLEVPYTFAERRAGRSKAGLREGWRYLRQLVALLLSEPRAGRLWKFTGVGATGLGVNAAAFAAAHASGASPFLAWFAGVEMSILTNFALNAALTFRDRRPFRSPWNAAAAIAGYHAATSAGIAVNAAVFTVGVKTTGIVPLAWAMAGATSGGLVNYFLAGRIAFRKHPTPWL